MYINLFLMKCLTKNVIVIFIQINHNMKEDDMETQGKLKCFKELKTKLWE